MVEVGGMRRRQMGGAVGWDKGDRIRGCRGELFISGTLFQFHSGMMEIFHEAKPRVEGVW